MGSVTDMPAGARRRFAVPPARWSVIVAAAALSGCQALAGPPTPAHTAETPDDLVDVVEPPGRQPDSPPREPPAAPPMPAPPMTLPTPTTLPTMKQTTPPTPSTSSPTTTPPTRVELARLLEEGEAAYRERRIDASLAAFQRVVSLDPAQATAWLRLGNLHQLRGNLFKALAAYRRVASRSGGEGADPAIRAKALYNLALINLELAQQSLRTLERIGPAAAAAGPREPLSAAVQAARKRLAPFAGADEPGTRRTDPAPAPRVREPARPDTARPDTEHALPRVDYIRGAPRP